MIIEAIMSKTNKQTTASRFPCDLRLRPKRLNFEFLMQQRKKEVRSTKFNFLWMCLFFQKIKSLFHKVSQLIDKTSCLALQRLTIWCDGHDDYFPKKF